MIRLTLAFICLALPAWAEIKIQEVTSPGGIDAWLVEESSIPFTALEIRFRGGTSLDAPDKRGAVNLMMATLEEGAADLDARGFARQVEELSSEFSFGAYDDTITIGAKFLTENRDASIELLRKAILEPTFDPVAVDRVREQVLTGLRSDPTDPDTVARQTFDGLAFGAHPYGTEADGTIESVSALTQQDMFDAHRATLTRDRLYVAAVGDINAEDLGRLLDDLLGALPETGAPLADRVEYGLAGGVTEVELDTPQSVALFGHAGIKRDDEDFFAAYILNQILGGSAGESRLMREVRVKRGLTYGVSSFLVTKDNAEMVMGQVRSANDRIAEAIDVIRAEWARIAEDGITQDELDKTKTYLTGAYPLRFDGNGTIANIMVGMQMTGLGVDYIPTRNDKVMAVTLEDVNRVARELLVPEDLHFVVVGQPEGLETTN